MLFSLALAWVTVTPEQLVELKNELEAVVRRYHEAGKGDPRARRVALYQTSMPLDTELPPPSEEES